MNAANANDPAAIVIERIALEQAFQQLTNKDQEILHLFAQGYSGHEIAAQLRLTDEAAFKRIKRAKHRLRQKYYGSE